MKQRVLALEIPDDQLISAIAEESSLRDRDLDALEQRIVSPAIDPAEASAIALTIGRAGPGRLSSRRALELVRSNLESRGRTLEARAVSVAIELLSLSPPRDVERGERGYRRADGALDEELLIEDPLAAHWHLRGRWGPPLRPDPALSPIVARGSGLVDHLIAELARGATAIVYFRPGVLERPEPPLRVMFAGFARDPSYRSLIRWSELSSVGALERRGLVHAAYEVMSAPVVALPARPSIPVDELITLFTRLLEKART